MRLFAPLALLILAARAQAEPVGGHVLDDKGQPIEGATVVAAKQLGSTRDGVEQARTDAMGHFQFDLEPNATWPDRFGAATAFRVGFAVTGTILLRGPDGRPIDNVLRLGAATSASGVVRDAEGQPIAKARVHVRYILDSPAGTGRMKTIRILGAADEFLSATTDAQGRWKISGLPASGKARIELDDPRFERTSVDVALAPASTEAAPFTARAGASISGRLVDKEGAPAGGIRVSIGGEGGAGEAVSDAEGRWTVRSLAASMYSIRVDDPSRQLVALGPQNIVLKGGEAKSIADIALSPGTLLSGRAIDADGKPIAGVQVAAQSPSRYDSATTGRDGRYTLRLAPGAHSLNISGRPDEFIEPQDRQPPLVLAEGATATRDWILRRGATLELQVLAQAKPLPGATIRLQDQTERRSSLHLPDRQLDAQGQVTFKGLPDGEYTVALDGAWRVQAPQKITIRDGARQKLQVLVGPMNLPTLSGRVVTPRGEPVAGATIVLYARRDLGGGHSMVERRQATSDAQGRYEIRDVPLGSSPSLKGSKAKHRALSAPEISEQNGRWSVPEIVLAPLDSKVAGRVLDGAGKPVEGAQVLASEGGSDAIASSNARGEFEIDGVPSGPVRLMAARDGQWGEGVADASKNEAATLSLRAMPELKGGDIFRAHDILDEVKSETRDQAYPQRAMLAIEMAAFDFDLALELASDADGAITDGERVRLFVRLARASPERAAIVAAEQIALVKDSGRRLMLLSEAGAAVARRDPELAREMWTRLQSVLAQRARAGLGGGGQDAFFALKLASALQLPERHKYLQDVSPLLAAGENQQLFTLQLAQEIAPHDPEQAEKLLRTAKGEPLTRALIAAIRDVAPNDAQAAERWLAWLGELMKAQAPEVEPRAQASFGQAALPVVRALAAKDAGAALALARRIEHPTWRARALLEAVRHEPSARTLPVLREAAALPMDDEEGAPLALAARLFEADEALAREMFEARRPRFDRAGGYIDSDKVARWAFYFARVDRAGSRLVLERAWARRSEPGGGEAKPLAMAMAACDVDRALEMAREMKGYGFDARRKLARYILGDEESRAALDFERWEGSGNGRPDAEE